MREGNWSFVVVFEGWGVGVIEVGKEGVVNERVEGRVVEGRREGRREEGKEEGQRKKRRW